MYFPILTANFNKNDHLAKATNELESALYWHERYCAERKLSGYIDDKAEEMQVRIDLAIRTLGGQN